MTTGKREMPLYDLPPTHMERLDLAKLEHEQNLECIRVTKEHDLKIERQKTARSRHEIFVTAAIAIAVAAVLLGIVGAITYGTTRPDTISPEDQLRQDRYSACVAAKGTWIDASSMCISEKHTVSN